MKRLAWLFGGKRKWLALVAAVVLAAGVAILMRPAALPDRPFAPFLELTDQQARRIEDWAEAGQFPADGEKWSKVQQAKDALMKRVLTPAQWEKYQPWSTTPFSCTNPWCPCHGRITNVARIMGWIRRHLPPGWSMGVSYTWTRRAAVATGRRKGPAAAGVASEFRLYVCAGDRTFLDRMRSHGFSDLGKGDWKWRAFARVAGVPSAESDRLLSLFRQACVIDHGRVKHGLRAELRDPTATPGQNTRRAGEPIKLVFRVTMVGYNMDFGNPYVGPDCLSIAVLDPENVAHTLQASGTGGRAPAPRRELGWGYTRSLTFDLMDYPDAGEAFSQAGAYRVTATYYPLGSQERVSVLTNTLRLTLSPRSAAPAVKAPQD